MSIFDDGFDIEDAAYLAGAIGFAEEAIRAEEANPDENAESNINIDMEKIKDTDLRLIYNMNPSLFKHIVNIIEKQTAKWKRDRVDREEVAEELRALGETEKLLGKLGDENDSWRNKC